MKNENLMKIGVNSANLIPEDERAVDIQAEAVVIPVKVDDEIIPEEERADTEASGPNEFDKAAELGAFSPVAGMGHIQGVLNDRLYAAIYVDDEGDRYVEVCEEFADGTFSSKLKFSQSDFMKASMCNFNPYAIKKDNPLMLIKSDASKFLTNLIDKRLAICTGKELSFDIFEMLRVIKGAWANLPVFQEDASTKRYRFYKRFMAKVKECALDRDKEHKAYNAFEYEEIEFIAEGLEMQPTDLLKTLREYGFLYLTDSSRGYQTCVRLKESIDPLEKTPIPSHTEWRYCVYKLEYFNSYKANGD